MGFGSGAATAAAVVAVVGGAVLLLSEPAQAPVAPAVTTAREAGVVEYTWPTGVPGEVVRSFVAPPAPWATGHRGVDLAVAAEADVRAAADGAVAFTGVVAGRGVVSIDHADGVRTTYEPVAARVGRGERVTGGQVIGTLEDRGHHCTPEPCLHWGARRGSDHYLDPVLLLAEDVVIRLLPEHRRRTADAVPRNGSG